MANNQLLASDNFASGSLAAGWSNPSGIDGTGMCQITGSPFYAEPVATTNTYGQLWTGLTWGNDQISEATIQTLNITGTNSLSLQVRFFSSGGANGYQCVLTHSNTVAQLVVQKFSVGTPTQLGSTVSGLTISSGDMWTLAAIGSAILVYQNGARVFYIGDATIASGGAPGFSLTATSAVTNAQVASWRGYSAVQQDGIWTKQGCILANSAAELGGTPNGNAGLSVNFGSSVFLNPGHNVYRGYWVYRNGSSVPQWGYAESSDGKTWSRYSSNPLAVISGFGGGIVTWKNGTAYAWGQSTPGSTEPAFFTSPDGVTWTNNGTSTGLTVSGYSMYSPCLLDIIGGTYYILAGGLKVASNDQPATFLFTSTDGLTWTIKNSGNSVIANAFAGANIFKIGSTYYLPATSNQPGQGSGAASNFDPVYGALYQSTDPTFITWTLNSVLVQNSLINDSLNSNQGGCAPVSMIDVNGTAFHYYQGSPSDANSPQDYQCLLATAPAGVPLASIVQFSETATVQIARDPFTNGAGPLSASWTTPTWSVGALQIVSGPAVQANTTSGSRCDALYTGASFSRNQYSEITIGALVGAAGAQFIDLLLCGTTSGPQQAYYAQIPSPAATLTTGALFQIIKLVAGVQTTLSQATTTANQITPQVGDVFRFAVTQGSDGSNILTVYQNGVQVLMAQDYAASLTSGFPGIQINNTLAAADAQVSLWAGGNSNVIPNYPPVTITGLSADGPMHSALFPVLMARMRIAAAIKNRRQ